MALKWDGHAGEARRRVQGLWVWGTNARMRECRPVPPAEGSAANGCPVRDSGAAMEGHATESVNFNDILVYVMLTQSSKTLRLTQSRLKDVTVWPLRLKRELCAGARGQGLPYHSESLT
jgi:hypothetical protein